MPRSNWTSDPTETYSRLIVASTESLTKTTSLRPPRLHKVDQRKLPNMSRSKRKNEDTGRNYGKAVDPVGVSIRAIPRKRSTRLSSHSTIASKRWTSTWQRVAKAYKWIRQFLRVIPVAFYSLVFSCSCIVP
ncbi:hypothetical protein CCUS01_03803 [Colletotrichum cuscutae]|uniref:Uncharacterized protein n=1 Tax=Colletotrichum cuscutae TaxID=1209917 RepID=A0AAI9VIE3_9PEZI|nr:hypothetical protein CCUS01_03803 [Colletotrichum cuscutae]